MGTGRGQLWEFAQRAKLWMVSSTEHTEIQREEDITQRERWPDEMTIGTETLRSSASAVKWASFLLFFSVCSVYSVVKPSALFRIPSHRSLRCTHGARNPCRCSGVDRGEPVRYEYHHCNTGRGTLRVPCSFFCLACAQSPPVSRLAAQHPRILTWNANRSPVKVSTRSATSCGIWRRS